MATIYVSYRSPEESFVRAVMSRLEPRHKVCIDYNIPVGVGWREHQLEELRNAEVFLVFVSKGSAESDFQNSEIGGARFSSAFLDGKLIIPALIDNVVLPRSLEDLDRLDLQHRDVDRAAQEIEDAMARRTRRVRLFISHAHADAALAGRFVDTLEAAFAIPAGALRCTSVPGYQLDIGIMAAHALRHELGSAACVVALLTPNSIGNDWVLFELGATWVNAVDVMPLLAGGLQNKDLPGALRGAVGGALDVAGTLDHVLDQLATRLGWTQRTDPGARRKQYDMVEYAKALTFTRGALESELKASFVAKRARIGKRQREILDHLAALSNGTARLSEDQLGHELPHLKECLFYRLEQLRLLGFLDRSTSGEATDGPAWVWTLSPAYRTESGL